MARKTEAQKREDFEKREAAMCQQFIRRFENVGTLEEAVQLVGQGPMSHQPGWKFYAHLGFFFNAFTVPHGVTKWELEMYIIFLRRLDSSGGLKPGSLQEIERRLRDAIAAKGSFEP